MATDNLPAPHYSARCPSCHAPAEVTHDLQQLPCGHWAMRTTGGVVVGWEDQAGCALNLARMIDWPNAPARQPSTRRPPALNLPSSPACGHCGAVLAEGARFCQDCGERV
jgi:hypothetical protein